jgi:glucose-1-phosphate thymidylyltransferase
MIGDGSRLKAPEIDAWLDCGKPETILETNAYLLRGRHHIHGEAFNCVFIEPVHIERGVVLKDSVIGPYVSVASGCVVERSIIRNSIINGNSVVRNMVLTDSILGDNVQLISHARKMNIGDHSLIEMQG